ncbi:MAG: TauD/TfdA family dioxygenase [Gammaproteobacteria bacterium]|nr:TauD/TfdA family dioxygenase [Gammaproteobacteria bacterium]
MGRTAAKAGTHLSGLRHVSAVEAVTERELPRTPDFGVWPQTHRIEKAAIDSDTVRIQWNDGRLSRYHFRWLRDGCACDQCVHPSSREQLFDIAALGAEVAPLTVEVDAAGALNVVWNDDHHHSRYHPGWLRAWDYSNPPKASSDPITPVTWDASFADKIPSFDGPAVLQDDDALYQWLRALQQFGLTRLTQVPCEPDAVERVAARVGAIRESNFGRTFDVRSIVNSESSAYTAAALPPHTDLPTREVQPGIQMLHCLENSVSGGESVMVDGFLLAEVLRRKDPDAFLRLTTTPLEFASRSPRFEYRYRAPMIAVDAAGRVCELRPGALVRAPVVADFDQMEAIYDAIQCFFRLAADPKLRAVFPIRVGDLLAMDNRRVLHARTAFDAESGERHLKGCYMDRDELLSRLRVLERKRPRRGNIHIS